MKKKIIKLVFLSSCILSSCSYPNSKLANIGINGLITDNSGAPLANQLVEVVLPADYGLKEIDLNYDIFSNRKDFTTKLRTDSSGNFNYTFNKIPYNTAFWFLPPLGNFPKRAPTPSFLLKFSDQTTYSFGWSESKLNYAVQRTRKKDKPPYFLTGEILRSERGNIDTCIANIKLRKSN